MNTGLGIQTDPLILPQPRKMYRFGIRNSQIYAHIQRMFAAHSCGALSLA